MASDVDICNLALARLGDEATVTSISPPDSSIQAKYCAKFYPLSLQNCLDDNNWGFATKTATLAASAVSDSELWQYAYAAPSEMINIIALYDSGAVGDVNYGGVSDTYLYGTVYPTVIANRLAYHGNMQNYSLELGSDGNMIIYTDQANALLKYAAYITNTALFPPTFVDALAWKLAANMAGVIIKGDVGVAAALKCLQAYQATLATATVSDAQNRNVFPRPVPAGIASRA